MIEDGTIFHASRIQSDVDNDPFRPNMPNCQTLEHHLNLQQTFKEFLIQFNKILKK